MLTSKLDPPSKPETTPKPDIAQRRTATGWGPLRAALKLLIRRPSLPLVHLGLLGFIGVMMMTQFGAAAAPGEIAAIKPEVAVVDHDDSQLSRALTAYLEDRGTPVEIGQTKRDLQDAAANSEAAYIAVIPAGYEAEFVAAAREDGIVQGTDEMPQLETVATLASAQSRYLDQLTTTYLHLVRAGLTAQPDADLAEVLDASAQLSDLSVGQSIVARPPTKADATRFSSYLGFAAYPLTAGVMILTGLIFHRFASGEVRRRNLAAPVPTARMTAQVGLAAGVVCVVGWVWVSLLGLFPTTGGVAFATESPGRFALGLAALLVYTLVPLSLGFFAASLGLGPNGLNGLGTILALAVTFLGGLFTADIGVPTLMRAVGQFMPTHWHAQAVRQVDQIAAGSWDSLAPFVEALAVELLFAATFAALGLLASRMRMQTATAGGLPLEDD